MSLDPHIHYLLFRHDCIIIPGLGGFVANNRSSFLNPAHHTFTPPSKRIAFNSSLRIGDGLLANHVSKTLGISYQDAMAEIDKYVRNSMLTIANGNDLAIDQVGVLCYDAEKNLQFTPDGGINYLIESFGLTTIHSPAIKREDDNSKMLLESISKKGVVRSLKSWRWMELIPAAAILTWLIISPALINNIDLGNLNPFAQTTQRIEPLIERVSSNYEYSQSTTNNTKTVQAIDTIATSSNAVPEEIKTASEQLLATPKIENNVSVGPEKETTTPIEKNISEPVTKAVAPVANPLSVKLTYVIGGCFRDYENAVKFREEALTDGFQAAIIGENKKGLHMVSLFSSNDANRANTEMELIKQKFQPQAWLFRK